MMQVIMESDQEAFWEPAAELSLALLMAAEAHDNRAEGEMQFWHEHDCLWSLMYGHAVGML